MVYNEQYKKYHFMYRKLSAKLNYISPSFHCVLEVMTFNFVLGTSCRQRIPEKFN